jgi:hypothetical protein
MPRTCRKFLVVAIIVGAISGILALINPPQAGASSLFDKANQALGTVLGGSSGKDSTGSDTKDSGANDTGSRGQNAAISALSQGTVSDGLRQALDKGIGTVTAMLGKTDGFNADPVAHIPLPASVQRVQKMLDAAGMGSYGDEIELRMNRAAENTMNDAGEILTDAVSQMTMDDAKGILSGPDDAATQYLRRVSGGKIADKIRPVMENALGDTGALKLYDEMMGQYKSLPMMPDVKTSLTDYATNAAMDGLFHYLAVQEGQIRTDPAKWTTDVLKKVFAAAK